MYQKYNQRRNTIYAANMTGNRSQRVAVVTGSSKGIGKAIAMEFAKERYNIVLNARDKNELSEAMNDIKKAIGNNDRRITYFSGGISERKRPALLYRTCDEHVRQNRHACK